MVYFDSLIGFEEGFITNVTPNTELDFLDSHIRLLEENVFRPIVEVLATGTGRIVVGSKILKVGVLFIAIL